MASIERIPAGRGRRRAGRYETGQGQQGQASQSLIPGRVPAGINRPGRGVNAWARAVRLVAVSASLWIGVGPVSAQTPGDAAADESFARFLAMLPDDDVSDAPDSALSEAGDVDGSSRFDFGLDDGQDDIEDGGPDDPETIPSGDAARDDRDAAELAADDDDGSEDELTIADVIASVYRSYPDIAAARQEITVAGGDLLSAYGAYDTKLQAFTLNEPTGFYENYRHGLGVARQTWWGGYVAAGYRNGRGFFQPWYKERSTDEGGEFKIAYNQPLLQGLAIDPQRVAVFQASLQQQAATPILQQAILTISREAAMLYWDWVLAGAVLEAQRELLELAEIREEQFDAQFEAGSTALIDVLQNRQLVADRRAKFFETQQKFQAAALKLGLYLRGQDGRPLPPGPDWLPERFPVIETPPDRTLQDDLAAALTRRPEPRLLQLGIQQTQWDRRLACNELLPRLDFVSELSQDVGDPASSKIDDKGQLELVIGVQGEVPIQRRKARGKIRSTTGKIAQDTQKLRLVRDKIANELFVAYNDLQLSSQAIAQYEESLRAAVDVLQRFRFAFDEGNLDLFQLNIFETKVTEVEIKLVESQRTWFAALADMQAALGLDPLEQAMIVATLPQSERPGPGNLPTIEMPDDEELERDLRRRLGIRRAADQASADADDGGPGEDEADEDE